MFINKNHLIGQNPVQLNYGVAVTDVDNDGRPEAIVAGFGGRNLILKWDPDHGRFHDIATDSLADKGRRAIGVAAADIDGDGREEIYILNTDTFAGEKRFSDRLFDFVDDEWTDLFSVRSNEAVRNFTAGRSVVALDRNGRGRYGFYIANYGGPARLYELDPDGRLLDAAAEAGLGLVTGGRGAIALPLLSDKMDVFAANERGPNFLFVNQGDGTFREEAHDRNIADPYENGRGITVVDGGHHFNIVYGNWEGPHRIYTLSTDGRWDNVAPAELSQPTRIRTVIAADFDNDGHEELFFNNIGQANRLFARRSGRWTEIEIGDALERFGLGTGAAVADFDGDGRLELIIAHGESAAQPLAYYHTAANDNRWLRVQPLTPHGAPARGAVVTVDADGRTQRRAIDAGSGYLCQMEPVAHFGLGPHADTAEISIRWPDGAESTLDQADLNQQITVSHPQN